MRDKIRVRFAPSPTGFLHAGGARTAIFNWLLARKTGGKFLLRIEDTDVARSGKEMVDAILLGLEWLGLDWDEELVFQSSRFDVYMQFADDLVAKGFAYSCFCTPERLKELRESQARQKAGAYKYDRHCLNLSDVELARYKDADTKSVIRLKIPEGQTSFCDQVYGDITVAHAQLDDFIILRSDQIPTYHLAVVVDDHEMSISHIIRGDDHLSNTPKHILLYQAFGWQLPVFAHVPLILGPDKQRLSKRHGATAVGEYQKAGYLADAVLNFLSLLGWSPGDDRELLQRDELIQAFDITGISRKSAVFDETKLEWMNSQYLNEMNAERLIDLVEPEMISSGLMTAEYARNNRNYILKIIDLLKSRTKRVNDFIERSRYFFEDPVAYEEKAIRKHWKDPNQTQRFDRLISKLEEYEQYDAVIIEGVIRDLSEEWELSAGKVIHPIRLALTGVSFSPGIFEVMELLGRETVIRRLQRAKEYLHHHPVEISETPASV